MFCKVIMQEQVMGRLYSGMAKGTSGIKFYTFLLEITLCGEDVLGESPKEVPSSPKEV